jgi:hypothetical protein
MAIFMTATMIAIHGHRPHVAHVMARHIRHRHSFGLMITSAGITGEHYLNGHQRQNEH